MGRIVVAISLASPFSFHEIFGHKREATWRLWRRSSNIRWKGHSKCFSIAIYMWRTMEGRSWLRSVTKCEGVIASYYKNYIVMWANSPSFAPMPCEKETRLRNVNGDKVCQCLRLDYSKWNLFVIDSIVIDWMATFSLLSKWIRNIIFDFGNSTPGKYRTHHSPYEYICVLLGNCNYYGPSPRRCARALPHRIRSIVKLNGQISVTCELWKLKCNVDAAQRGMQMSGFAHCCHKYDNVSLVHLRGFSLKRFNVMFISPRRPRIGAPLPKHSVRTPHKRCVEIWNVLWRRHLLRCPLGMGNLGPKSSNCRGASNTRNQPFVYEVSAVWATLSAYIYFSFDEGNINNVNNLISFYPKQRIKSPKNRVFHGICSGCVYLIWFHFPFKRISFPLGRVQRPLPPRTQFHNNNGLERIWLRMLGLRQRVGNSSLSGCKIFLIYAYGAARTTAPLYVQRITWGSGETNNTANSIWRRWRLVAGTGQIKWMLTPFTPHVVGLNIAKRWVGGCVCLCQWDIIQ